MGVLDDIELALYTKLTTTGGTAVYGSRVFAVQAPQGTVASVPYVVFHHIAGGDLNISPSRVVDLVYQVDCWAESQVTAKLMASYVEAALHEQPLTISGWNHIGTTQLKPNASVENDNQKQYWRRGADYRIRASK